MVHFIVPSSLGPIGPKNGVNHVSTTRTGRDYGKRIGGIDSNREGKKEGGEDNLKAVSLTDFGGFLRVSRHFLRAKIEPFKFFVVLDCPFLGGFFDLLPHAKIFKFYFLNKDQFVV